MLPWEVAGSTAARSLVGSLKSLLVLQALCILLFCSCALKIILPQILQFLIPLLWCLKCSLRISTAPKAPVPAHTTLSCHLPMPAQRHSMGSSHPKVPAWFLNQIALWIGFLSSNIFKLFFLFWSSLKELDEILRFKSSSHAEGKMKCCMRDKKEKWQPFYNTSKNTVQFWELPLVLWPIWQLMAWKSARCFLPLITYL